MMFRITFKGDSRPYPRFLPPMQRLIARHPRLFVDALKDDLLEASRPIRKALVVISDDF